MQPLYGRGTRESASSHIDLIIICRLAKSPWDLLKQTFYTKNMFDIFEFLSGIRGVRKGVTKFFNKLAPYAESFLDRLTGKQMTQADKDAAKMEYEYNDMLARNDYDRKIDFYQRFESPSALVSQWKGAGVNPMALFGGSSPSVSASGGVGSGSVNASVSSGGESLVSGLISGLLGAGQLALSQGRLKLEKGRFELDQSDIESQIRARDASTVAQEIDNRYKERMNDLEIERRQTELNLTREQITNTIANRGLILANADYAKTMALYAPEFFDSTIGRNNAEAQEARSRSALNDEQAKEVESKIAANEAQAAMLRETCKKIREEVKLVASQKNLTDQQVKESEQKVKVMKEEVKKISAEIGLTNKEVEWYAANHTEVVDYHEDVPGKPVVTYKDQSGVYTVLGSDGETRFKRPYNPGSAGQPSKRNLPKKK